MKKISLLIPFLLMALHCLPQQSTDTMKHYRCVIELKSFDRMIGEIYQTRDSGISLLRNDFYNYQEISVYDINEIKIRRKGSIGRGILIGALYGAITGAIIGLVSGDDTEGFIRFTAADKALAFGTFLSLPGGLIGGIAGTANITIPINGSKKKYQDNRKYIIKYSLIQK